jgi:hypothetical protein
VRNLWECCVQVRPGRKKAATAPRPQKVADIEAGSRFVLAPGHCIMVAHFQAGQQPILPLFA